MRKGKVLLLLAAIMSIAYVIYSFNYWGGAASTTVDSAEQVGA